MKVMVAGGAGFIGSHLCDRLLADGHVVLCIDSLATGSLDNLRAARTNPSFRFHNLDICDPLPDTEVDQIYNLACPASPKHYQIDPIKTMKASVFGTFNLLEYARSNSVRFLQVSTSEVYGDPEVHPQIETYAGLVNCTGPRACYDEGKRAAETLCYDFNRQHGVEIRVARLFNTYGPRMAADDGRVVPNFVTQALDGDPLTIYGAGTQTRSFCYIDDTIEGLVRLMGVSGSRVGPINIGNPVEFTVRELSDLVISKTGSLSSVTYQPLPEDDPRVRRPDISRAKENLNWNPAVSLDEGLNKTIDWYRKRSVQLSDDRRRNKENRSLVGIIGGGPAGLTAAYEFQKHSNSHDVVVFESSDQVGGIARTEIYKGYRFDIGGHRFFTKVKQVEALWREVLPEEFLRRPRMSRIYYKGLYYAYPLKIFNALRNMGIYESARIILSYVKWRIRPFSEEANFEQWVTNRFGGRLFWHFFKSYTEKVWGMPCNEIQADWAAQRIKNLSLRKAAINAITGANDTTSLIEEFDYPRMGPGMMWEAFRDRIEAQGGEVRMNSLITRIHHTEDNVAAIEVTTASNNSIHYRFEADHFISSMPITELVLIMDPPAPPLIRKAAQELKYRDFLIVTLILKGKDIFPDNWIYIHSPEVQVGRIQNFRSWSEHMVPDPETSSIGMEYFCLEGDDLWNSSNADLIKQASLELEYLGLGKPEDVLDGTVIRQPKAYPVYDGNYREALDMIRGWLSTLKNLQMVGRNGMHRYNNQDHSMLTAMLAVQNVLGGSHDLWSVNVEQEYHEDIESSADLSRSSLNEAA